MRMCGDSVLIHEREERLVDQCGEIAGCGEIRVNARRAKRVLHAGIQAVGNGDPVRARSAIAQSRDELGSRRDIGCGFQPEREAKGTADIYLLKQRAGSRPPDHRPIAERD